MVLVFYFGIVFLILLVIFVALISIVYYKIPKLIKCDFNKKHVFITGGSKGIGKAITIEALNNGCNCVTIVARDLNLLKKTSEELVKHCSKNQFIQYFQLDLTSDSEKIESVIREAEKAASSVIGNDGGVDILINNAGNVIQGGFDEIDIDSFEKQMRTNYLSIVYTTRAVIKRMKNNKSGHIAFVSSAAGQCAMWGYTAYSPSKFAIRGFADSLYMELLPFNIGVTVLYPPNTNTEGFQEEIKTMTLEIKEISHAAGVFSPQEVASSLVNSMSQGYYTSTVGLEGWMLGVLTAGAAPEPRLKSVFTQILLSGILRGVMLIYLGLFNSIVQRCHIAKKNKY